MPERYFPVNEEFGYSARLHQWVLNGQPMSEEEATVQWECRDHATTNEETYYCGMCRCQMPISHFPH